MSFVRGLVIVMYNEGVVSEFYVGSVEVSAVKLFLYLSASFISENPYNWYIH
jgi:hypothetical protein